MKSFGLRLKSFNAFHISRPMRRRRGSSLNRNLKSPVARAGVNFKLSPMLLKPERSLAINPGDSGIEKPKFEVWLIGLVGAG
jgi:hypothetical protein